jgi:hypothetical protein
MNDSAATGDHSEGFEKERLFHELLGMASEKCPNFKASILQEIIRAIHPEFDQGLFAVRPCVRKLRYIGYAAFTTPPEDDTDEFFEVGKIYESIDFNGATYTIAGYDEGQSPIGCAYFEWIK